MKKWIFYFFAIVFSFFGIAQNNITFSEANEAYNKGDYNTAISLYKKILDTENHSANLYFNLANSYYKQQKIAQSIYYYEKALALNPNSEDIQVNYNYAKQTRLDTISPLPKGFLSRSYQGLVSLHPDFWAWISIISMFLFVIGFILFHKSYSPLGRKIFFGIWIFALLVLISSFMLSFLASNFKVNNRFAIVFSTEITIQSEPNLRSEQLFKLHEGTKVKVLEDVDSWNKILLADGREGWLPKKEIKEL